MADSERRKSPRARVVLSFSAFAEELRITDLSPDMTGLVLDTKTFRITAQGLSEEAAKPILYGQEIPSSLVSNAVWLSLAMSYVVAATEEEVAKIRIL